MKTGFTLIELLVVVLIIGILAAIALPQYQKAVIKAEFAQALPILKSAYLAQERYYLEHGSYDPTMKKVDLSLPWEGTLRWHTSSPLGFSNDDWSLQLYTHPTTGDAVSIGRLSGRYQGAAFMIFLSGDTAPKGSVVCSERVNVTDRKFQLKYGDFCVKLYRGIQIPASTNFRVYTLP